MSPARLWSEAAIRVHFPLAVIILFILLLYSFMRCVYTVRSWCVYKKHGSLQTPRKKRQLWPNRRERLLAIIPFFFFFSFLASLSLFFYPTGLVFGYFWDSRRNYCVLIKKKMAHLCALNYSCIIIILWLQNNPPLPKKKKKKNTKRSMPFNNV